MSVPNWYEVLLLAVAAWRVFQLIAHDDILDRPRRWALRLGRDWQKDGDDVPEGFRAKWALFLECPYCAGFHLSLGIYLFWIWFPTETLVLSMPFVLNAGVIGLSKILGNEE